MDIQLPPDLQARLNRLAIETGRPMADFVQDAMAGYLDELGNIRGMLDSRYDDLKRGTVQPIPAEEVGRRLRRKSAAHRAERV